MAASRITHALLLVSRRRRASRSTPRTRTATTSSCDDFKANPIGTFFDPEKVSQAYADGQPFGTLQPAIRAGQFLPDAIPGIDRPV